MTHVSVPLRLERVRRFCLREGLGCGRGAAGALAVEARVSGTARSGKARLAAWNSHRGAAS
jgi:hypothetical protein